MQSIPLAEASALRPFIAYLEANGSCVDRHLEAAHIPRELVDGAGGKITKRQAIEFLERSKQSEGAFDLGYRVGEGFGPG